MRWKVKKGKTRRHPQVFLWTESRPGLHACLVNAADMAAKENGQGAAAKGLSRFHFSFNRMMGRDHHDDGSLITVLLFWSIYPNTKYTHAFGSAKGVDVGRIVGVNLKKKKKPATSSAAASTSWTPTGRTIGSVTRPENILHCASAEKVGAGTTSQEPGDSFASHQ